MEEKDIIKGAKENSVSNQIKDVSKFLLNEADELKGFKLFFFKFYVKLLKVKTVIKLCQIRAKIDDITPDDMLPDDAFNPELLAKLHPLYSQYITVGLLNDRPFSKIIYPFLYKKVADLNWQQIYGLNEKIQEKSSLGFFLILSRQMTMKTKEIIK